MLLRAIHNLPLAFTLIAGCLGAFGVLEAHREKLAFEAYTKAMNAVEISAPSTAPEQSQESVELALEMFAIRPPATVAGPRLDENLEDRGLTTGGLILPHKEVTVGPTAFTSWAVLGSTLAHELEVHVEQSFFKIVATDYLISMSMSARRLAGKVLPSLTPSAKESFENDGTWKAERDAYMYEIRNAGRFGLTTDELNSIWRVMDYYYPARKTRSDSSKLSASSEAGSAEDASGKVSSSEL
jgi:hypothetical protein